MCNYNIYTCIAIRYNIVETDLSPPECLFLSRIVRVSVSRNFTLLNNQKY